MNPLLTKQWVIHEQPRKGRVLTLLVFQIELNELIGIHYLFSKLGTVDFEPFAMLFRLGELMLQLFAGHAAWHGHRHDIGHTD